MFRRDWISPTWRRDAVLSLVFLLLTVALAYVPTHYEDRVAQGFVRAKGRVTMVDNSAVQQFGIVKAGDQDLLVEILDGPYKGQVVEASNQLTGKMELDKMFLEGDQALLVLTLNDQGEVIYANPQDHYRIDKEVYLFAAFAVLLLLFGGLTGAKALLSFVFSGFMVWKILVPKFLDGYDPVLVSLGVVLLLTAAIVFLVGGVNRRGFVAFAGAMLGILTTCALALYMGPEFRLHGAVKPYSETLLYSGFAHLDLTRIFFASIFLASSGAVMDLAMDVAASMYEVVAKRPDISRWEAMLSGFRVGRAVVGTMTTTLLLAYSGGYITLLMVFMAQGVPLVNVFNINYVAAEVLNTLVGSFGLITVAPFTAVVGALMYVRPSRDA